MPGEIIDVSKTREPLKQVLFRAQSTSLVPSTYVWMGSSEVVRTRQYPRVRSPMQNKGSAINIIELSSPKLTFYPLCFLLLFHF